MSTQDHNSASEKSPLQYRRIRAPKQHAQVLHLPEWDRWEPTWQNNFDRNWEGASFQTSSLNKIRDLARSEIAEAAFTFTRKYRDVQLDDGKINQIVMSGHQPTLYHPGVWYKNFVLDHLGRKFNALPINLIVDNDLCNTTFVNVPASDPSTGQYFFKRIPFDSTTPIVPFENRKIVDVDQFQSFGDRARQAISPFVTNPIIAELWPHVLENDHHGNLGLAIANGRHRFEQDAKLQTLEIPVSHVAQTQSFSAFLLEILTRHQEFQQIYNSTIRTYRALHKIKNEAQPIPELCETGGWTETPFWIWTRDNPKRRSLFVKQTDELISISDQVLFEKRFTANCILEELHQTITSEICVRPKALMTTMFCRLIISDLFIHGVGGAKYDQLTDAITQQLFKINLPTYITATATFQITKDDTTGFADSIAETKQKLRNLQFHPETFVEIPDSSATIWIDQKKSWIKKELPSGQRLMRHHAISEANQNLQNYVSQTIEELNRQLVELQRNQANSKVTNCREYSFGLYNPELIDQLKLLPKARSV